MLNYNKKYLSSYLLFIVTAIIYFTINHIVDTEAKSRIGEAVKKNPEIMVGEYGDFISYRGEQSIFSIRKKNDFVENEVSTIRLLISTSSHSASIEKTNKLISEITPILYKLWYLQFIIFPVIPTLFFLYKNTAIP
jgi:hypothetical protein